MTLKERCNKKGFTLRDLSQKIDVSHEYLSKLNTGNKTNPSLKVLKKISKELGVSIDEVIQILKIKE